MKQAQQNGEVAAVDQDEASIALSRIRSKLGEDSCNTIYETCRITHSTVYHTTVPGEPVEQDDGGVRGAVTGLSGVAEDAEFAHCEFVQVVLVPKAKSWV